MNKDKTERRGVEKGFGGWARTLSGVAGVRSEDDSIEGPFGRFSTASLALGAQRRGGDERGDEFRVSASNQFSKSRFMNKKARVGCIHPPPVHWNVWINILGRGRGEANTRGRKKHAPEKSCPVIRKRSVLGIIQLV